MTDYMELMTLARNSLREQATTLTEAAAQVYIPAALLADDDETRETAIDWLFKYSYELEYTLLHGITNIFESMHAEKKPSSSSRKILRRAYYLLACLATPQTLNLLNHFKSVGCPFGMEDYINQLLQQKMELLIRYMDYGKPEIQHIAASILANNATQWNIPHIIHQNADSILKLR